MGHDRVQAQVRSQYTRRRHYKICGRANLPTGTGAASGAERAYRKAADKLTELPVAEGALHAVRLKQKSKTKRKKKIAAAIYEYQADCDGEWGEISLDFQNGKAEVIRLADWDTIKTSRFANKAIPYLLNCENEKLPKEMMVAFE